jgi:hypothetical protein
MLQCPLTIGAKGLRLKEAGGFILFTFAEYDISFITIY